MAKSKKNRQQDFQKVKLKVGKKLKKADNVTNASFKTRAIQISQQLKTADTSQPSTKKKQNIMDLFSQCRHYSASVRVEAVNGLKELITAYPEVVPTHLSDILERVSELLADKESTVRQGAIRAFKVLLPLVSEKQISPFFQLLCAHLCCAMTHIYDDIQVDSLSVLDLLLENYPRLMIYKSNQVLSNFIEQISRQQGQGQAKRSLGTNPNSATSSVKWRSSVLNRLQKFLTAVLKFHGSVSETLSASGCHEVPGTRCGFTFIPDEAVMVQPFPSYFRNQWMMPGFTISSNNLKGVDKKGNAGILNGKFTEFADTLVPLMLECWVECAPSKVKERNRGGGNLLTGDNVAMMYNVLQVTQLLWECTDVLTMEESDESGCPVKYLKEFEQHFMANFPYSVNTKMSKKDKKHQNDNVQVSAELLNLTICNIMTHFIGGMPHNQNQSHVPVWLPLVTKYLRDFLRGKYEKTGLGQSSKIVVTIMRRFLARGLEGPVVGILSEMYTRFEAANVASTEKRIYLQFFADTLLADDTSFNSPVLRRKFLQSLPELLPLCSKESSEMASLVISTMKKAACQRCADLLDRKMFASVGQQWYDPQQGIITSLPADDQRNLIGSLYYVPELGPELTRILVSLARCTDISDDMVAFMIQVVQNRFLQSDRTPEEATVHIGLLTNLLLGVTRAEIEDVSGDKGQCPVLGSFSITKHSVLEGGDTLFDRQCFLVEIISGVVGQFYNTDQVVEVMFQFVEKTLKMSASVPLQLANGMCKFAESLRNIPSGFVSLLNDLCISLVNHLIMWQHSTNQNAVQIMLDVSCSLLMKTTSGIECLLTKATECFSKGLSLETLILILKTVMLFLTDSRKQCITCSPECLQKLQSLNTILESYLTENKSLVTKEMEKLVTNFAYLVSSVK